MSASNTLAVNYLVYFVGAANNTLSDKYCCVCKKNLVERCLQFCCDKGCMECMRYSSPFDIFGHGICNHCKHGIYDGIKHNGYFCFVDRNDVNVNVNGVNIDIYGGDNDDTFHEDDDNYKPYLDKAYFEQACNKNKLYCAYCMKKHLEKILTGSKDAVMMAPIFESDLVGNEYLNGNCLLCSGKVLSEKSQLACCSKCKCVFHYRCIWKCQTTCPNCKRNVIMAKEYGQDSNIGLYFPGTLNLLNLTSNLPTTKECDDCKNERDYMYDVYHHDKEQEESED